MGLDNVEIMLLSVRRLLLIEMFFFIWLFCVVVCLRCFELVRFIILNLFVIIINFFVEVDGLIVDWGWEGVIWLKLLGGLFWEWGRVGEWGFDVGKLIIDEGWWSCLVGVLLFKVDKVDRVLEGFFWINVIEKIVWFLEFVVFMVVFFVFFLVDFFWSNFIILDNDLILIFCMFD